MKKSEISKNVRVYFQKNLKDFHISFHIVKIDVNCPIMKVSFLIWTIIYLESDYLQEPQAIVEGFRIFKKLYSTLLIKHKYSYHMYYAKNSFTTYIL